MNTVCLELKWLPDRSNAGWWPVAGCAAGMLRATSCAKVCSGMNYVPVHLGLTLLLQGLPQVDFHTVGQGMTVTSNACYVNADTASPWAALTAESCAPQTTCRIMCLVVLFPEKCDAL